MEYKICMREYAFECVSVFNFLLSSISWKVFELETLCMIKSQMYIWSYFVLYTVIEFLCHLFVGRLNQIYRTHRSSKSEIISFYLENNILYFIKRSFIYQLVYFLFIIFSYIFFLFFYFLHSKAGGVCRRIFTYNIK